MRILATVASRLRRTISLSSIKNLRIFRRSASSSVNGLITHFPAEEKPSKEDILVDFEAIKARILIEHDSKQDVNKLLDLTDQLYNFPLGRFLIKNKGALSGFWTDYIIRAYQLSQVTEPLERFILTRAPIVLATRQRFQIFQEQLLGVIQSEHLVCSVPCGVMADLFTLDLDRSLQNVRFIGIDLDDSVFPVARALAHENHVTQPCELLQRNAWDLDLPFTVNVLTSNGLNIYESDDAKVIELYRQFNSVLSSGGTLITSALTVPPGQERESEWDMSVINQEDLQKQIDVFSKVLQSSWANFRTSQKTTEQLEEAGFVEIQKFPDKQGMFPTFVARKPN